MDDLKELRKQFLLHLGRAEDSSQLQNLRSRYLGKKGEITGLLKSLTSMPPADRPAAGKEINELKDFIENQLNRHLQKIHSREIEGRIQKESIDVTLPGPGSEIGGRHPISLVLDEVIDIFISMGFGVEEGPEIELDFYNFEALNIPRDHPARDMQDTFYINDEVVMRTHTSPVQVRVMQQRKPPLRFIAPGKVYRCDADISHTPMFHQVEGLMVDTNITFANLKSVLESFLHSVFTPDTPVRFRPSYFPFTEPSAEVDIGCIFCKGSGCRICKTTGWIEILGSGMVNPKVFKMVGYNPRKYTGFAFGMGIERITMLKYGIDDIRLFYENDLRFLGQF
ncbi:phenylalanine--tRNA ligase alpha subunit [bacterium BMS3Abin07]|nr:phenylalanine--tRNA ligase alpha subunit [bacterium BMS3Abin07]GBE31489.1 phenylalanine--tRNA ligase alpha subunit [bacterium BMS3Bbin05]HDO23277.1 phenylalanine--tRNA ligase subunit alpha [Nitrospirota bacterium]HDZ88199.1 phenylalanine--tRNA ligase subunit alpha [Nitrospirota bacterium]